MGSRKARGIEGRNKAHDRMIRHIERGDRRREDEEEEEYELDETEKFRRMVDRINNQNK